MKAYLCSIGERTTEIARDQLLRLGFDVVLLDAKETWIEKYKRFIRLAEGPCLRVDADFVANANIVTCKEYMYDQFYAQILMVQFNCFDFYKNDVGIGGGVFYSKECLEILKKNTQKLDAKRPEASAWRLEEVNRFTLTADLICGMHGFLQTKEDMDRALKHKIERNQIQHYDFDLAFSLAELYGK